MISSSAKGKALQHLWPHNGYKQLQSAPQIFLCGCRSKTDVARHLGLAVPVASRLTNEAASPGVDVNMAEEDVAAMLMALPHGKPLTARFAPL
jgi:hypothetical protein